MAELARQVSGRELPSGFAALDAELAGGGFTRPGITEILADHTGIGELSLVMKAVAAGAVTHTDAAAVMWVVPHTPRAPDWIPYAPALAQWGIDLTRLAIVRAPDTEEALWVAEQALKSGACRAVLMRLAEAYVAPLALRRLQQAALAGESLLWLLRPLAAAGQPSPAATRLALTPLARGELKVELLKRRGRLPGKSLTLAPRPLACLTRAGRPVKPAPAARPAPAWLPHMLAAPLADTLTANVRQRADERR